MPVSRVPFLFLSLLLALSACGDDEPALSSDGPLQVRMDAIVRNPSNALSYYVFWETSRDVPSELRYDCGDGEYAGTLSDPTPRRAHEAFLMGLWEGASCELTVVADEGEGEVTATDRIASAGPVPSTLPDLDVQVSMPERMQPGWTFFSLARANESHPRITVALDAQGRYRWYLARGSDQVGSGDEITLLPGGRLLLAAAEPQQIVNWEGDILFDLDQNAHHDAQIAPWDPEHILYLGVDTNCFEHTVEELDMNTGEIVWQWSLCENWTPQYRYGNWSHVNTVTPVPGERAVVISSRNQDALFKIQRDTDELEWVLGRDGDFAMEDEALFYRQHAPEFLETDDGSVEILLFDNGVGREELSVLNEPLAWERRWSRLVTYRLSFDESGAPDRADVVWEYDGGDRPFAENRSDVDRLPNGNTLAVWVWIQPGPHVRYEEIDADSEVVWRAESPEGWASYRIERIEAPAGFVIGD